MMVNFLKQEATLNVIFRDNYYNSSNNAKNIHYVDFLKFPICFFFLNSEFLSKNSPREINVDSKTLETVNKSREEMRGKPESMRSVTQSETIKINVPVMFEYW